MSVCLGRLAGDNDPEGHVIPPETERALDAAKLIHFQHAVHS